MTTTDPCPSTTAENLDARCAELTATLTAQPLSDRGRAALLLSVRGYLRLRGFAEAAECLEEF